VCFKSINFSLKYKYGASSNYDDICSVAATKWQTEADSTTTSKETNHSVTIIRAKDTVAGVIYMCRVIWSKALGILRDTDGIVLCNRQLV
jgi:hypothetical protein